MKRSIRVAGTAVVALAATAVAATPASAAVSGGVGSVFVLTDNLSANTVVAFDRGPGGALRQTGVYRTGGRGGQLDGSVVDHTASQGALALDRAAGLLYAVNPGSDTLTVFGVHGDRLDRQQAISSGGAFPVSVAVHGDLVYVLNGRGGGSIQGYRRVGRALVRVLAWHRTLGLDAAATPEFTHTPGQVAFTPDGTRLIITTKAGSNAIVVFTVDRRRGPSAQPVVHTEPGAVPFAVAFDPAGRLVVAEAGPNAVATFRLGRDNTLTPLGGAATGQAATCWIVATGDRVYTANAGSGNLSGYTVTGGGELRSLGTFATGGGQVDVAATPDGRYLYAQTGADGHLVALRVGPGGTLTAIGEVAVPGAVGGEGVVAS
ncbi:lactonase family protein [Dactylosporangium sp. CA-092794]|uniref:lactonase family protein n=1 Tax=Dactylosporangium sp. CA-092794 TaxID=3239929 RepID=UPI003D8F42B1